MCFILYFVYDFNNNNNNNSYRFSDFSQQSTFVAQHCKLIQIGYMLHTDW